MSETTESISRQPRSRLKGMAQKTVKRLDFAMRRPSRPSAKTAPVKPAAAKPAAAKPAVKATPVKPTPAKPVSAKPAPKPASRLTTKPVQKPASRPTTKPAPKPAPVKPAPARPAASKKPAVSNHGMFIDFVPSHVSGSLVAPSSKLAKPAPKPVSRPTTKPAPKPAPVKPAPKPVARPATRPAARSASRPTARPVSRPATRPAATHQTITRPAAYLATRLNPASSHSTATRPAPRPKPTTAPRPSRLAHFVRSSRTEPEFDDDSLIEETDMSLVAAFDEELDALESISDDIFDDIDGPSTTDATSRLENKIEAEASEFVKEPKPLFEDPLVQISKLRDEHRHKKEAAEAAEFKERTKREAKKASYLAPYTLGGRSPFLTSVNVEKRPLSAPGGATTSASSVANGPLTAPSHAKSSKSTKLDKAKTLTSRVKAPRTRWTAKNPAESPVKLQAPGSVLMENTYRAQMKNQLDRDAKEIHRKTMMASESEDKGHRSGMIVAIILTVLLGAAVGAVIYLIFFQ